MALKPRDIDPALLQMLGQIVIRWSQVETRVGQILASFLGMKPAAMYLVTQGVSSATLVGWTRTVVTQKVREEASRAHMLELLDEIDDISAERNLLVHGIWNGGSQPQTAEVQTVQLERKDMIKVRLVTLADLQDLDARLDTTLVELSQLVSILKTIR